MSDYPIVWVDYAEQQYLSLDDLACSQLDTHLADLARDPTAHASYDPVSDHWSSSFGEGHGILVTLISSRHHRIVILRIIYIT